MDDLGDRATNSETDTFKNTVGSHTSGKNSYIQDPANFGSDNSSTGGGKYKKHRSKKHRTKKHRTKKHRTKKHRSKKHNKSKKINFLTFCKKYAQQHGLPNARSAMSNPNCKKAFHAMKH